MNFQRIISVNSLYTNRSANYQMELYITMSNFQAVEYTMSHQQVRYQILHRQWTTCFSKLILYYLLTALH